MLGQIPLFITLFTILEVFLVFKCVHLDDVEITPPFLKSELNAFKEG